jgi:hypothetical protein
MGNISAQNFLKSKSESELAFTVEESKALDKVKTDLLTKQVSLVEVGNVLANQVSGTFEFEVPDVEAKVIAKVSKVIFNSSSDYSWIGMTDDGSLVTFSEKEGFIGGIIQSKGQFFELIPVRDHVSMLREHKIEVTELANVVCAQYGENGVTAPPPSGLCDENFNCPATLTVLILIPTDAQAWLERLLVSPIKPVKKPPTYYVYLQQMQNSIRAAFVNSGIQNVDFNFEIEYVDFTNYTSGTVFQSPPVDFSAFTKAADLTDKVQTLYKDLIIENDADFTFFLTSRDLYDEIDESPWVGADNIFGRANNIPGNLMVAEINQMISPRYTCIHELGHLLGGRHNKTSNFPGGDNDGTCEHGFKNGDFHSIMSLLPNTGSVSRTLRFSDKTATLPNGTALGDNDHDFTNFIKGRLCNYKINDFSTTIYANKDYLCLGTTPDFVKLEASTMQPSNGGQGLAPYNYEWRWNETDIFDESNQNAGTISYTVLPQFTTNLATIGILSNQSFFVQVKVTSSDGLINYKSFKINVRFNCFEGGSGERSIEDFHFMDAVSIIPNPNEGLFHLILPQMETPNYLHQITIYNTLGVIVFDKKINSGKGSIEIDISNQLIGVYYGVVKNESSNESTNFKIIKSN